MINTLFQKYKYETISASVVILITLIITAGFSFSQNKSDKASQNITPSPDKQSSVPSNKNNTASPLEGNEESFENRPGLQKTEDLTNGTVKNYFSSSIANRPNIIVSKGDEILFQSSITDPKFPVKIIDYTSVYGSAKWILDGSKFYGDQAKTYVYPDLGIAFIANAQTGEVLEQHVFQPILIDDYIKKYGEDIKNPTPAL